MPVDVLIKTAIELGIDDIRKNPWLVQHIMSDFVVNPYLRQKYGENQVKSCIEWLQNNEIDTYLRYRKDRDRLPCVTVTLGESIEKPEMKFMADKSPNYIIYLPNQIGKPIPYVLKPFAPVSFNADTMELIIPPELLVGVGISSGMILVNPSNGTGFIIESVTPNGVVVNLDQKTIETATVLGIVPQYQYYKAKIEHTFFHESYHIECTAHGDPNTLLWLHAIVLYSLLRYRESLLEANGITETLVSSSDIVPTETYSSPAGEEAFSRVITMSAQVENTWVKSPQRYIESVVLGEETSDGFIGGISVLSNLNSPSFVDKTKESWYTVEEDPSKPNG